MSDTLRLSFDDPTYVLRYGSGLQRWSLHVRKSGTGPNPTIRVDLAEGPTLIGTPIPTTTVSSSAGQVVEGLWDAQPLSDRTGASVEALITVERGAGDAAVDIAGFPWISQTLLTATTLVDDNLALRWHMLARVGDTLVLRWNTLSFIAPPPQRTFDTAAVIREFIVDAPQDLEEVATQERVAVVSGSSRTLS